MEAKPALRKQKKYDWKDSNLALFGSKLEHEVKKESAEHEPAWQNAGQEVGRKIWRIVNFQVTDWPEEDYGKFYDGDSYIVLDTYNKSGSDALYHDIHFWIGKYSTQDEYGTAAYKTVELATYLGGSPIQHREVQEHESKQFLKYFVAITYLKGGADSGFRTVKSEEYSPRLLHFHGDRRGVTVKEIPRDKKKLDSTDVHILDLGLVIYQWNGKKSNKDERVKSLRYLKGGADSGFRTVKSEEYSPRLLHFHGDRRGVTVKEIPRDKKKLDSTDVHILDLGLVIYQWNGKKSNKDERVKAMQYIIDLKEERCGKAVSEVLDEESTEPDHKFYTYLDQVAEDDDDQCYYAKDTTNELYRLSDESGTMSFSLEKTGSVTLKDFDGKDVFIFDTKTEVFVFIGKDTSINESKFAMTYAHTYLMQTDHPLSPISCILEQAIDAAFNFTSALAA
ncbi:gelsolin-like protein 2 [Pecten maximus]|uniref:gelsolin-like protein 2 n=1 Tax=Pecten maximus TaxID=6579 RepID=UPI0014584F83|nr:gelsolin-like protein 2 [Pecten maximus]